MKLDRVSRMVVIVAAMAAVLSAQSRLPKPAVPDNGIVNGASFQNGPISPGSIISIFGTNLGLQLVNGATTPISDAANSIPLATSLGGQSVVFTDDSFSAAAPLFFVSGQAGQFNAQVPWELAGHANVQMSVKVDDGAGGTTQSDPMNVAVGSLSPAIFTLDFGPGRAAAINVKANANDDVVNGSFALPADSIPGVATQPAAIGGVVTVYVNGLGPVSPAAQTGHSSVDALRSATQTPTVKVGGVDAQVLFAGLAPEFVGLYQINLVIPEGVTPGGQVPIQIIMGEATSRGDVNIAVRAKPAS